MDKNTEQKLKRIWCERLVIGLLASTTLGFFITGVPVLYSQIQAQALARAQARVCVQMPAIARAYVQYYQAQVQYDQAQAQASHQGAAEARAYVQYYQAQAQAQAQALARAQARAQAQTLALARAYVQYYQAQDDQAQDNQKQTQALQYQFMVLDRFMVLGTSALCFILMLLWVGRQRNQISLPLTGQLIIVLPEEYIAELGAIHQQMKSEKRSVWFIRKKMLLSVLEQLWAYHIHINVENLWLPKSKAHNKIDD